MTDITAQDIERAVAQYLDHGPDDEIVGTRLMASACPVANVCNIHLPHEDNEHFEACQSSVALYVNGTIVPRVTIATNARIRDFVCAVDCSGIWDLTRKAARDIWLSLERGEA